MWMHSGIKDLIDVLLVAFFLYQTYKSTKSSGTLAMFSGVVSLIVVWISISQVLEIRLMGATLGKFISVSFIVLVILFQDETHRFPLALGSHRGWKFLGKLFSKRGGNPEKEKRFVAPVVLARMSTARGKTGALIAIQQDMDLTAYEYTGEMFNTDANARLIEGIFFKNSPLYDGAMIMADNRIKAAGCILSVTQSATLPKDMGLRHRSGLGVLLGTDAPVIITSEERRKISVAHKGRLSVSVTAEELRQILSGKREVTNYY